VVYPEAAAQKNNLSIALSAAFGVVIEKSALSGFSSRV
jgi:hypothetical protein